MLLRDCADPDALREELLTGLLLSLYPLDISDQIYQRKPTSSYQAAEYLQSYLDTHPWRKRNLDPHRHKEVSGFGGGAGSGGEPGKGTSQRDYNGRKNFSNKDTRQEVKVKDDRTYKRDNSDRPIVCFGCGIKGHKRSECPEKVARVNDPGSTGSKILSGTIGKMDCEMTLDSGADRTVVRADLVDESDYTGRTNRVGDYFGYWRQVPTALVWSGIEKEYKFKHEVLVVPSDCTHQVLLGNDLPMFDNLYELSLQTGRPIPQVKVVTRAESKKRKKRHELDKTLNARDGAQPTPCVVVDLIPPSEAPIKHSDRPEPMVNEWVEMVRDREADGSVEDGSREVVRVEEETEDVCDEYEQEEDAQGGAREEAYGEDDSDDVGVEEDELDIGLDYLNVKESDVGIEIPLPNMVGGVADREHLRKEQEEDETLSRVREWANKAEKGYAWEDGLLIHTMDTPASLTWKRIVVPESRRKALLKLAHCSMLGGHISHSKTTQLLNRKFTWPNMSREVKQVCRTCAKCQKAGNRSAAKAPLNPLPVVDLPFLRLAFDLVGLLPRSKSGHKYILTAICLASKYPEAVPLKRVNLESVIEGLCDIFSRTGVPTHILTDQGSVFTSRLVKELCSILDVKHLKTSPYHPESNGCLERWHSTLKVTVWCLVMNNS